MKYRIRYDETTNDSWLWFTPFILFAFLFAFMGVKGKWVIEQKKHWWNKWKIIKEYSNQIDAYIDYFKLKYDLEIEEYLDFPHNKNKKKKQTCKLTFKEQPHSPEYRYAVGYKPINYHLFYHVCYSEESFEDALGKLYCDLEVKKLIHKI